MSRLPSRARPERPGAAAGEGLYLVLVLLLGAAILLPTVDVAGPLSQGDHGRDLYAFRASMEGALPYRDYYWIYGPLMPFYYGAAFEVLGVRILSVLAAKTLLELLGGLFFYLALRPVCGPRWSLLGSAALYAAFPQFFYTYNHTGGLTALLAAAACMMWYVARRHPPHRVGALGASALAALVKLNMGLPFMVLAAALGGVVRPRPGASRRIWSLAALAPPILVIAVYGALVAGLPSDVLRQSFPYGGSYRQVDSSLWGTVPGYARWVGRRLATDPLLLGWFGLTGVSLVLLLRAKRRLPRLTRRGLLLWTVVWGLAMHEVVLSGRVYREVWALPAALGLAITLMAAAAQMAPALTRRLLLAAALGLVLATGLTEQGARLALRRPDHYFGAPRARVYVENDRAWLRTVTRATDFLSTHIGPDESFLALPYDFLYAFLLDRRPPLRLPPLFAFVHVSPRQEEEIIEALPRIPLILLSNRAWDDVEGQGHFGRTHCRRLAARIAADYDLAAAFGDADRPGGWIDHHGVRIYRRRTAVTPAAPSRAPLAPGETVR